MLKCKIPNFKSLTVNNLVLDYNGTLACGGSLIKGVKSRIEDLADELNIYVLTADTFGTVEANFKDLPAEIVIVNSENGTADKVNFIEKLGAESVIAIGNGNNDSLMLKRASLGIALIGAEGLAIESLLNSDLLINNICDGLDILLDPNRLIASLRK
ncbi:MAG: HAD family hydrolase [Bacillota bacterium]